MYLKLFGPFLSIACLYIEWAANEQKKLQRFFFFFFFGTLGVMGADSEIRKHF